MPAKLHDDFARRNQCCVLSFAVWLRCFSARPLLPWSLSRLKLRDYDIAHGDAVPRALRRCVLSLVSDQKNPKRLMCSFCGGAPLCTGWLRVKQAGEQRVVEGFSVTSENLGRWEKSWGPSGRSPGLRAQPEVTQQGWRKELYLLSVMSVIFCYKYIPFLF